MFEEKDIVFFFEDLRIFCDGIHYCPYIISRISWRQSAVCRIGLSKMTSLESSYIA